MKRVLFTLARAPLIGRIPKDFCVSVYKRFGCTINSTYSVRTNSPSVFALLRLCCCVRADYCTGKPRGRGESSARDRDRPKRPRALHRGRQKPARRAQARARQSK